MEHASISSHEIVPEIDLKDIETPRTPDEVYGEIKRYFYKDRTSECLELVQFFEDLLSSGKIIDKKGDVGEAKVLTKDTDEVKAFFAREEVSCLVEDLESFNFFFETMQTIDSWIKYYDEPTRKVFYKYEDGMKLVSCLCEAIVEAPVANVLSLFAEIDLFKDWFPNVTHCEIINAVTPIRGLYTCKQAMPWPVWPRDMTFKATGMFDRSGVAALSCIKSVEAGSTYFGVQIPECADGHVRIDIKRGYHYFQRIDDTKTRYVTIFNSDPKLQYAPSWMMNYFMTKICYQMLVVIQEKAVKVPESEFGERMKRRRDFYGDVERMIAEFARENDEARSQAKQE